MEKLVVKFDTPEMATIEQSKADKIKQTFQPMAEMLKQFEAAYGEIVTESEQEITQDVTARAKRLRLDIAKVRIETEKLRKAEKEEYLRAGKAIDGVSNILKWAVIDKEKRLREIEDHFEIMERQRLEALQAERVEALSQYVEDAHERDLAGMEGDVWQAYLAAKKKDYEDRLEAERKAEEERQEAERKEKLRQARRDTIIPYVNYWGDRQKTDLAELSEKDFKALIKDLKAKKQAHDEEQERIRKENERLKKEAEEKERLAKIEAEKRAKAEAERQKKEEAERRAREKEEQAKRKRHEAELRAAKEEADRVRKEQEADRKRREAQAKREAEEKARAEAAARNKKHRAKVNREAAEAIAAEGVDEQAAKNIVRHIVGGKIPHVSINY